MDITPDEAVQLVVLKNSSTFTEIKTKLADHLFVPVQYYLLSKIVYLNITIVKLVAAIFIVLTALYLIWVSYSYKIFNKFSLLPLIAIITTNSSVFTYGTWGRFDYSQRIFFSVILVHILLFLYKKKLNITNAVAKDAWSHRSTSVVGVNHRSS